MSLHHNMTIAVDWNVNPQPHQTMLCYFTSAVWSMHLLFVCNKVRFSGNKAHIIIKAPLWKRGYTCILDLGFDYSVNLS